MAFATLGSIHSNLTKNKPKPGTALNTELIVNGMFNSYTLAANSSTYGTTVAANFPSWTVLRINMTTHIVVLCNSSAGNIWGTMFQSPSTAGLTTGGGNYHYVGLQQVNTTVSNTFTQTIPNLSAGTYTFTIWLTARITYYKNTQS